MATLSQCIQHILLKIHQYRVQIIYKPCPKIFTADWLSQHNHEEGKDKPIKDIYIRIDAIQSATDMPECISIKQIQQASEQNKHLQYLKCSIIAGWLNTRDELLSDLRLYWSYRDDLAVIDGVVMKGKCIIIPAVLKQQVLDQLHTNHMGIKKTKLVTCKSVYCFDINTDIQKQIKRCNICLGFQQMQPKEKMIHHDIHLRPWKMLSADIFHFNNKNYLCIVDYHSKFPVIKKMEGLSTESLITTTKVIFAEYGIPYKLMSEAGSNFISDKFRKFCSRLNIEQAVSSSYYHQSNGQVEACIKFIKCTLKMC